MDSPTAYQTHLDQLIAYATAESRKPELIAAKAEYFGLTGEVFEDDKVFEMRMASFLDYYLYDRISPATGKTPAQEFAELNRDTPPPAGPTFKGFTETVHGLFEVRKIGQGYVRMRELFSGKDYDVTERRQIAGLEKGDLLEARLIPFDGHLWFSSGFCYHPKEVRDAIRKEVKRRKKNEPNRHPRDFTFECAKMALKTERYRQIAVEKIYDFEHRTL
ncbi:MAG: hypothetical protein ACT4TC_08180 [Myxococcaceae bacterium]